MLITSSSRLLPPFHVRMYDIYIRDELNACNLCECLLLVLTVTVPSGSTHECIGFTIIVCVGRT